MQAFYLTAPVIFRYFTFVVAVHSCLHSVIDCYANVFLVTFNMTFNCMRIWFYSTLGDILLQPPQSAGSSSITSEVMDQRREVLKDDRLPNEIDSLIWQGCKPLHS